jgi:hypothetical protein
MKEEVHMFFRASQFILMLSLLTHYDVVAGEVDQRLSDADRVPNGFRVFSSEGNESLTAICKPKNTRQARVVEVTCRFTHVRFQAAQPSEHTFASTLEEAVKTDQMIAAEYRRDPKKAREEWERAMHELRKDLCSNDSSRKLESRIATLDPASKRRRHA